jgi:putative transposase
LQFGLQLTAVRPGSADAWAGFPDDMLARGLRPPLLVISDRAPGLMAAAEMKLPQSLWQSCLIHRARNLLARVPNNVQSEVKADYWSIFDGIEAAITATPTTTGR